MIQFVQHIHLLEDLVASQQNNFENDGDNAKAGDSCANKDMFCLTTKPGLDCKKSDCQKGNWCLFFNCLFAFLPYRYQHSSMPSYIFCKFRSSHFLGAPSCSLFIVPMYDAFVCLKHDLRVLRELN